VAVAAAISTMGAGLFVAASSGVATASGGGRPLIHSVSFSGVPGNYTVVVRGQGFGGPEVPVPFVGTAPNFRIGDDAQPGSGEWGYIGDGHPLDYTAWAPSEVDVSGLGGQPGDAVVIAVWNAVTQRGATWGGNIPPVPAGAPTIRSVAFSSLGTPADLRVVVKGTGFGPAPVVMPYIGDLNVFSFWDGRARCGASAAFTAGGAYFGNAPADAVTLRYKSWTADKIVVDGFRGAYGTGCSRIEPGDPVAINVWNSQDSSVVGPQTAKRGLILYGIPGN
jgi:hypothetical protein